MIRANRGDAAAYRQLLVELGTAVESYLHRHFGASDFVEDCVQECLLSIHRARGTWDPQRSFRPWLFTIVRNKAIDQLRRRGTRAKYEVHEDQAPRGAEGGAEESGAELAVQVGQLLAHLRPEYRDALILTKLRGYSVADAASELGVTSTALKTRVHRALAMARRILEAEDS